MINAQQARELTKQDFKKSREERVVNYLNTVVEKTIKENCLDGFDLATVNAMSDRKDNAELIVQLFALGYEVTELNNQLVIEW